MKKIIVMLAFVVVAFVTKAAYVDWFVSGSAGDVGSTVYLLTSEPTSFENVSALSAAAVGSAEIIKNGRNFNTGDQMTSDASVTKDATYFFALVSANDPSSYTFIVADGLANLVYDPNAQESSPGNYDAASVATISAGTKKSFGGSGDVPEPTSGLLLVVGAAALALRRKQK